MRDAELKNYTLEHIEANRFDAPLKLAEMAFLCLEWVRQMVLNELDFMFKGGNSLLVILDEPRRFSIDVDISTPESKGRVDDCVAALISGHPIFTRFEKREHQTKPWLPLTSYKIFFPSLVTNDENFIMLDAQLKASDYEKEKKPIRSTCLYHSDVLVSVPRVSSLIGDKLLTLGPSTLGIPLGKNKEGQRLKHAADVSLLSRHQPDLKNMRVSLAICMDQENALQKTAYTIDDVFTDTIRFCAEVIPFSSRPDPETATPFLKEAAAGIDDFREHLFSKDYAWSQLQTDLARAALCFSAVKNDTVSQTELITALSHDRAAGTVTSPKLSTLKKTNPGAAGCWQRVLDWCGADVLDGVI